MENQTFISYSQNLEDVMLWRALKHVERGFYVDVGANDPKALSVTRAFYDRGWKGINIDPITYDALKRERTRDINLEVAVSDIEGEINFFVLSDAALCTSDPVVADQYRRAGETVIEKKVPSVTLNQILDEYANPPVHFINIDVEGAEVKVLKGFDLSRWRPWIILIEATIPTTTTPDFDKWEHLLVTQDYEFAYFDGLNRFYIAKEHSELMDAFRLPPNIFDQYVLSREVDHQQFFEKELKAKENVIQIQNRELDAKEKTIQQFQNSFRFWVLNGPIRKFRFIQPILSGMRSFRRFFLPRVGVVEQYHPKSLIVPTWYLKDDFNVSDKKLPSVTIVTPSLNQGEFINRTVRSVLDQSYPKLEYIIQDGISQDDTLNILKTYQAELTHFESCQDNGQADAINRGFRHATGEIMAYLNADDILLPGTLKYLANYFTQHPDVDVIYSHRVIINENDQEIGRWVLPPHDNDVILWRDYIPQETMFWRQRIWEKIGGHINENYQFAMDWDLILRFRAADANFKRLPRFLAAFRTHSAQKSVVQYNTLGMDEITRILRGIHDRDVDLWEINKNIQPYLRRSLIYHLLYRLRLLRF
jgi:FkbM family methyltransferase